MIISQNLTEFLETGKKPILQRQANSLLDESRSYIQSLAAEVRNWSAPNTPAELDRIQRSAEAAKSTEQRAQELLEAKVSVQRARLAKQGTFAPQSTASKAQASATNSRTQLVTKHAALVKERQRLGLVSHSGELSDKESRLLRTLRQLPPTAPPAEKNPAASEEADAKVFQRFETRMNELLPTIQHLSKQPQ